MPQVCSVCAHSEAFAINEALVIEKRSNRAIACQFGVGRMAVQRHREHVPQLLVRAAEAKEVAEADTLLDRIESLQARTLAILEAAEQSLEYRTALAAIAESRRNLELIGEVTKELNRTTPVINLELHTEYVEIRATIVRSLAAFPEAREAVVRALEAPEEW